jgi:hypothetical protein
MRGVAMRLRRWWRERACAWLGLCPPETGYRDDHAERILRSLRAQVEVQRRERDDAP